MKLESKADSVASPGVFFRRLGRYLFACGLLGAISLAIGMVGYRCFERQSWPEAFVNSAMLLSAMGPVSDPQTDAGKIFAGCYALYCGLVFLFTAGLLVTPFAHRMLHLFHADPDDDPNDA